MHSATFYRDKAAEARRVAELPTQPEIRQLLLDTAQDLEEIAIDLERGAIEVVDPGGLPQRDGDGRAT